MTANARLHALLEQVCALHELVDQTDPNDPIGIALTKAGLARKPAKTDIPPILSTAERAARQRVRDELVDTMPIDNAGEVKPPWNFCIATLDKLIVTGDAT